MHHLSKLLPVFKNLPYFVSGNEVSDVCVCIYSVCIV